MILNDWQLLSTSNQNWLYKFGFTNSFVNKIKTFKIETLNKHFFYLSCITVFPCIISVFWSFSVRSLFMLCVGYSTINHGPTYFQFAAVDICLNRQKLSVITGVSLLAGGAEFRSEKLPQKNIESWIQKEGRRLKFSSK